VTGLVIAASVVCALSAAASGVCIAVAYHTPPALRDAAEDAVDAIQSLWRHDPPSDPPDDKTP
jgi:hypothetical protein